MRKEGNGCSIPFPGKKGQKRLQRLQQKWKKEKDEKNKGEMKNTKHVKDEMGFLPEQIHAADRIQLASLLHS